MNRKRGFQALAAGVIAHIVTFPWWQAPSVDQRKQGWLSYTPAPEQLCSQA